MNALATSLVLAAILGGQGQPTAKLPLGKDTTYFTGPLDKEGYIDYQAAFNERLGKGIMPDRNANALLWQAIGPAPEGLRMPAEFFKLLGIAQPPPNGQYFLDLRTYLKDHAKLAPNELGRASQQLSATMAWPWKAKDYPQVAAWLAANDKPLAMVIEATRRSDYYNPVVALRPDGSAGPLTDVLLPNVQFSRELARALASRALLRVEEQRFDEAWQDLLACHRLGRLVGRGGTVVEALVGLAIEGIAGKAELAYLDRAGLKKNQDRLKDLQDLPPIPPLADKIDVGERIVMLETLQLIRRGKANVKGGRQRSPLSAAELQALDQVDWKPPLQKINRWYDRLAAAMRQQDRAARRKEMDKIQEDLKTLRTGTTGSPGQLNGEAIGDTLLASKLPEVVPLPDASDRNEQSQRNLHVAFALAAYHRDHARYPDKLDALAPKFLAVVPRDIYTGRPLIYLPQGTGYLLYSVGVNGKDEQGRGNDDNPKGDDPNVRMPLPAPKPRN